MPPSYPMSAMGVPDYGGGSHRVPAHRRSIATMRGPAGRPDVTYRLTAALSTVTVAGRRQRAYTFDRRTPGPTLVVHRGDVVQVVLRNRNIAQGTTIHWHGLDVPAGVDGVPGVTQDAVLPGQHFVYRFRATQTGTYWYHSHQLGVQQVQRGLVGALVILPKGQPVPPAAQRDVVAVVHSYGGRSAINGRAGSTSVAGDVGGRRLRFVNTDQSAVLVASTVPYQVVAIDGKTVHGPTTLSPDHYVEVPAAGRVDIVLDAASTRARVGVLGGASLVLGGTPAARLSATTPFQPWRYGTPDPSLRVPAADRTFDYVIGQRRGFLDGRLGNWFTIDHQLIPNVPRFMVARGDVVRFRIVNHTLLDHPMHLHGQPMLVLRRNGRPTTGSPWRVDTLQVHPGESYLVSVVADNPGDWMFHCHILAHAGQGLMTTMSYLSVRTPYLVGRISARLVNVPE